MFILIWIIIVIALLIFVAIPEHEIAKEDAEKSIRENREDWMIYFGVKE